jgi:hypothetical protein
MSGQPATSSAAAPRVLLVDEGAVCDVFEVIELTDDLLRARSPFLFEVGEELRVRIERDGAVSDAVARVRAHTGSDDDKLTELELSERSEPRRLVSG